MAEPEDTPEPVLAIRHTLTGIGIPGAIILVCAAIGVGAALFNGALSEIGTYIRYGAITGLVLSFLAVGEILAGLLAIDDTRIANRLFRTLGYILVWSTGVFVLVTF